MSDASLSSPPRKRVPPTATRAKVKDVTRVMIIERGLNEVKARMVAKAAAVSVGTVYNLFGHLDELIREINGETYDDLFATETDALAAARAESEDVRAHLSALADAYLTWVGENMSLWLATLAFNRSRGESPDWYAAKEARLLAIIEDALEGSLPPGDIPPAARALWASIHGIVTMSLGARGFAVEPARTREQMQFIIDAVADRLD